MHISYRLVGTGMKWVRSLELELFGSFGFDFFSVRWSEIVGSKS